MLCRMVRGGLVTVLGSFALASASVACGGDEASEPGPGSSGGAAGSGDAAGSGGAAGASGAGASAGAAGAAGGSGGSEIGRYEPDQRLDENNVSDPAGIPLGQLELPEPPKSGFRLVAPPREVEPGEEIQDCIAWPYPEFTHKNVYAARLYTTSGLHHSNMYGTIPDAQLGPSPYPECNPGADNPFGDLPQAIPDVLFANSTQIEGGEAFVFPPGMAFKVDTTREVASSIHFYNPGAKKIVVELAYDFYTVDDAQVQNELVPFVFDVRGFNIDAHASETLSAECTAYGGNIVALMPHNHQWTQRFTVDLLRAGGEEERVYDESGFDTESDIRTYDPPLDLAGVSRIRHRCEVDNTTDHAIGYGIGENEMCMLFGFVYPPKAQVAGISLTEGSPCISVNVGGLGI
jgi:hypothetical protein